MSECYDRDGNSIPMMEFEMLHKDRAYARVGKDELDNGFRVSTVWVGMDYSFGGTTPLIFETMVFAKGSWSDEDMDRYSTIEEAEKGHAAMVEKWKTKEPASREAP